MLNAGARLILFLSSYAPLSFIFMVLYWNKNNLVVLVAALALVVGVVGLLAILASTKADMDSEPAIVADYRTPGDEVMGYVVGYLIPFVGFTLASLRQAAALLVFLLVLAYLYTTTDMIHINPTLHLLRYNVCEVTFQQGIVRRVITRKRVLRRDDERHLIPLSDDLWLDKED